MLRRRALFGPGAYRVSIAHLVERTGLDFGYLEDHELPVATGGLRGRTVRRRIGEDYSNALP